MFKKILIFTLSFLGLINMSAHSNQSYTHNAKSIIKGIITQTTDNIKQSILNIKDDICNNPIAITTELAIIATSITAVYKTGRPEVGLSCFMSGQFLAFAIKCFKEADAESGHFNIKTPFYLMTGIASTCLGIVTAVCPWCSINVDFALNNQ